MLEVWRDVLGYEGYYQVSNLGRVKSLTRKEPSRGNSTRLRRGRFMKPKLTHDGYYEHALSKDKKRVFIRTHRLVLLTFEPIEDVKEFEVNHINGTKTDNLIDNLEWVTPKQNIHHSIEIGLQNPIGESNSNSKTTNEQVIQARLLKNQGKTYKEIADAVNIPVGRVKRIVNSYSWKHLPSKEELGSEQYASI